MSTIERRIKAYEQHLSMPWRDTLSGPERIWMVVYPPSEERRLRRRVEEFALATKQAGHGWKLVDITTTFSEWLAEHRYRDEYFEHPEDLQPALGAYRDHLAATLRSALAAPDVDSETVVALLGAGSLFGLGSIRLSGVVEQVEDAIVGRLLIFFPGERDGHNFRLLDARDGWNYLAIAIDDEELVQ